MASETCANCGRIIGKLETPQIHGEHVVCAECKAKLDAQYRKPVPGASNFPPGTLTCSICGSKRPPIKKPRGSMAIAILLFLCGMVPGLIYLLARGGYKFVCPDCGANRGQTSGFA